MVKVWNLRPNKQEIGKVNVKLYIFTELLGIILYVPRVTFFIPGFSMSVFATEEFYISLGFSLDALSLNTVIITIKAFTKLIRR